MPLGGSQMFKNYLTVAIRNLARHKAYTFINVAGLAIGLACSTLILLYLQYEFSYDRHHSKADRIYKVIRQHHPEEGEVTYAWGTQGPLGSALADEYPEVERATRFLFRIVYMNHQDNEAVFGRVSVVDNNFFSIFDYTPIEGDIHTGLQMPFSAFITRSFAQKVFGQTNPIGKTLWIKSKFFDHEYTITGLLENAPENSIWEFHADVFTTTFPPSTDDPERQANIWERWLPKKTSLQLMTYILLAPNTSIEDLKQKLPDFEERHLGDEIAQRDDYLLAPLTRMHLYVGHELGLDAFAAAYPGLFKPFGDIHTCYAFGLIGIFIVVVACINFMNLSTARSTRRMREVGLRKVVGAKRTQLVYQFLGESVLLSIISLILALGLTELTLPALNGYLYMPLALTASVLPILLILAIFVGLLAGAYPAFFLSSFRPSAVLKVMRNTKGGHAVIRKGLVVFQFAISMVLIVGTIVVFQQTQYLRTTNLGFNKEALIVTSRITENARAIKTQFEQLPDVQKATISNLPAGVEGEGAGVMDLKVSGTNTPIKTYLLRTDHNFLSTYQIPLLSGRQFTPQDISFSSNMFDARTILLNETAARQLGLKPGDFVNAAYGSLEGIYQVAGIVQDFHNNSLHNAINPLMLIPNLSENQCQITMRVNLQNLQSALTELKQVWATFYSPRPFEYVFIDAFTERFYQKEQRQSQMFAAGSGLAIAIACLGLLGLIAYTAEVRTKEIGIRKVLGATEASIVRLLTKEFLLLVGLASLLAWPVAYYTMGEWLQSFAYRIDLSPLYFIVSTGVALVITLITIAYQAMKAARANPIEALRYE
jgi:putative ABC transport system permease protein